MSVSKRILTSGAATFTSLGLSTLGQVALVPLFLRHWTVTNYGTWLTSFGLLSLLTTYDLSLQEFTGNQFLKVSADDHASKSELLRRALRASLFSSAILLCIVMGMGVYGLVLGSRSTLLEFAGVLLLSYALGQSVLGILGRFMVSYGRNPIVSWLGVLSLASVQVAQLVSVIVFHQPIATVATYAFAQLTVAWLIIAFYANVIRGVLRDSRIVAKDDGTEIVKGALGLSFNALVESLQQSGFRVILAKFLPIAAVTQFSTLRTVANTTLQSMNALVWPVLPELMRVLSLGDRVAVRRLILLIWAVAVLLLSPALLALQYLAPSLFRWWTAGKVAWDGVAFGFMSGAVLINGAGQAGRTILRGQNQVVAQMAASSAAVVALVVGTILLVPEYGIRGAAIALWGSELVKAMWLTSRAKAWMHSAGLELPRAGAPVAFVLAIVTTGAAVTAQLAPSRLALGSAAFALAWIVAAVMMGLAFVERPRPYTLCDASGVI